MVLKISLVNIGKKGLVYHLKFTSEWNTLSSYIIPDVKFVLRLWLSLFGVKFLNVSLIHGLMNTKQGLLWPDVI